MKWIDYRKFHAVFEHKMMRRRRLKYLKREFGETFQSEVDAVNQMIQHTSTMRLLALKYNKSLNPKTLEGIIKYVKILEEMDAEFMDHFLELLIRKKKKESQ